MGEPGFQALRMLCRCAGAGPEWGTEDDRHLGLAAKHETQLSPLIDNLIHRNSHEIAKLELGYGAHAGQRRPDGRPRNGRLGDGCITHALLTKFFEKTACHAKGSAINTNIFTHQKNTWIALHLFTQREANRLSIGHLL